MQPGESRDRGLSGPGLTFAHPIVQAHEQAGSMMARAVEVVENTGPTFPARAGSVVAEAGQYGRRDRRWLATGLSTAPAAFPDLETPFLDFQTGTDASGVALFRQIGVDERIELATHQQPRAEQTGATKLFPGDPSPILGAAHRMDRARREEAEHRRQQMTSLPATTRKPPVRRRATARARADQWPTPPAFPSPRGAENGSMITEAFPAHCCIPPTANCCRSPNPPRTPPAPGR